MCTYNFGGSRSSSKKVCHPTCPWVGVMMWVWLLGITAPLKFRRAKNVQNLMWFRITLEFDCKYLWNAYRSWQIENGVINGLSFHIEEKMPNFAALRKSFIRGCWPTLSRKYAFCICYGIWYRARWLLLEEFHTLPWIFFPIGLTAPGGLALGFAPNF